MKGDVKNDNIYFNNDNDCAVCFYLYGYCEDVV